jgi:peptide/nickel transport system permease protein
VGHGGIADVLRLILARLWQAVLVMIVASFLCFLLVYVSGDPVRALVPLDASPADMENIKVQFDQAHLQYVTFVKQAVSIW